MAADGWFIILEPMSDYDDQNAALIGPFNTQIAAEAWVEEWQQDPDDDDPQWDVGDPTDGVMWASVVQPQVPGETGGGY